MVGGGTSYDVYFRIADKPSRPLHNHHTYATEIHHGEHQFYRVYDAIDRKERWQMSAGSEKWEAHKRHEKVSNRLAFRIAKRAFPELGTLKTLPSLWANWNAPSETKTVNVRISLPE
jgi:hypothetical protein